MPSSPPDSSPAAPAEGAASPVRWRLHAQLFAATVASVFFTGMDGGSEWWTRALTRSSFEHGLLFAGSLLAILVAHESGHYIAARIHKVEASLPYFIPMPYVSPFGTMGAVIRMSGSIRTRRALLDIGASGPLAGLVFAIPLYLWGVAHPTFVEASSVGGDLVFYGDSILTRILDHFAAPATPPGMIAIVSPVGLAAWAGLFVTMINLLPVGQLDGGHVAYALFGPRQNKIAVIVHRAMLAFFFVSVTSFVVRDVRSGLGLHHFGDAVGNGSFWLIWFEVVAVLGALSSRAQGGEERASGETLPIRTRILATVALALLAAFGRDHSSPLLWIAWVIGLGFLLAMEARSGVLRPHPLLDHPPTGAVPLDRVRAAVAWVTLVFFVLLFMPTPIAL